MRQMYIIDHIVKYKRMNKRRHNIDIVLLVFQSGFVYRKNKEYNQIFLNNLMSIRSLIYLSRKQLNQIILKKNSFVKMLIFFFFIYINSIHQGNVYLPHIYQDCIFTVDP
jgi:hypothetical protein